MRQFRILLSLLLLISTPLNSAVAVTFPSTVPTGEITGGTFSQYFRNAVENPCPSNSYMIGFSGAAGSYMRPDCLTFSDISVYASGIIGGTEGYVTRFGSGGSGIVNSVIFETGGRIGFGTTTPAVELDIAGRIKIAGGAPGLGKILVSDVSGIGTWSTPGMAILSGAVWTLSGNDIGPTDFIGTLNAEDFRIFTNNSQKMVVNTIGNVGIGVSNPTARLEVNGQVKITGGSPGSGKLLVSDTAGLASWISPASLVDPSTLTFSGTDMYIPRFTSSGSLTDSTAYQSGSDLIINDVRVGKGSGNILDNTAVGTRTLISNTTGNKNTALGYEALKDNTTGNHNTALGGYSLTDNTTGIYNTAVGKGALISNTTGNYNIGIGNYALYTNNGDRNIAIGSSSMWDNTTGAYNTAIGWSSLYSNTIGMYNTAIGDGAMTSNTTADGNTALGYRPLYWNTTGEFNTANGYGALFYNSTGSGNVANGAFALYNSIGDNNTALGRDAGRYLSAGNNNIFIGANTQSNISDSSSNQLNIGNWIYGYEGNIGIGVTNPGAKLEVNGQIKITGGSPGYNRVLVSDAAGLATWQTISGGSGGVVTEVDPVWLANSGTVWRLTGNSGTTPGTNFVGTTDATDLVFKTNNAEKLRIQDSSSNLILSGAFVVGRGKNGIDSNVALGGLALANTTGAGNTGLGHGALYQNSGGINNVAVGIQAMTNNSSASNNTAVGGYALQYNTTGNHNSAFGIEALWLNNTGSDNTALGAYTLYYNKASYNTAIGSNALINNINGEQNVALGAQAGYNLTGGTNNILIGYNVQPNISNSASNQLNIGNWIYGDSGKIGIGVSSPSYGLDLSGSLRVGSGTDFTVSGGYLSYKPGGSTCNAGEVLGWNSGLGAWVCTVRAQGITGSGLTTDYVTKWNGLDLVNSQIFDTATGVGIGTSSPGSRLEVAGQIKITGGSPGAGKVLVSDSTGLASWSTPSASLSGSFWSLSGNAITPTQFIGSTNAEDLIFKTSNIERMRIRDSDGDVLIGTVTLGRGSASISSNIAFGTDALKSNVSGVNNTAIGNNALTSNTIGAGNMANGANALAGNTSGNANTAIGLNALQYNTIGYANLAVGWDALKNNDSGYWNTAVGVSSLVTNDTGYYNTALGFQSLFSNTTGYLNTANGANALFYNTTGRFNTAIGPSTLISNIDGDANTAAGYFSLYSNVSGARNTANGYQALFASQSGSDNTAIGYLAGTGLTTGSNNIAIGSSTPLPSGTASNQMNIGNAIFGTNMNGSLSSPAGNIGIGTTTPGQRLTVSGGTIQIIDGSQGSGKILTSDALGIASWQTPAASLSGAFWSLSGNTISPTQFIGSTNNEDFRIWTNNSQKMVITSDGKVGIGKTTPSYGLDLSGSLRVGSGTDFTVSGGYLSYKPGGSTCNAGEVLGWNSGLGAWVCTVRAQGITGSGLTANYTPKWNGLDLVNSQIFDTGTGVGIGTTSPRSRFDVNGQLQTSGNIYVNYAVDTDGIIVGAGRSSDAVIVANMASGTGDLLALDNAGINKFKVKSTGTIQIIDGSQGSGKILTSDALGIASWQTPAASLSGAFWSLSGNTISPTQFIGSTNNEDLRIWTNNSQKMVITSDGKVGIGVSSPSYGLDLSGSLRVGSGTDFTVSGGYLSYKPGGSTCNAGEVLGWNSGLGAWVCTVRAQGITGSGLTANYVPKWNGLDLVNSATYDNGTNVGIGTTSPGQKLTVSGGTIQIINGSEGSGKVLTSDTSGIASWQTVSALYTETDPIWSAASGSYYTKTEVQTSGQAAIHFANLTNVPGASTSSSGIVRLVDSYTGTSLTQAPTANAINNLKNYTDALVAGLSWKQAVRVATTGNISLTGLQNIDGYITTAGDRVLVKNQTTATENGIYIASAGAWSRATDADSSTEFESMAAYVSTGGTNQTTGWVVSNPGVVTLGATNITYSQFSGNNAYIGANPIQISGNTISILQANTTQSGYLSPTDYTTFNNKFGTVTSTGGLKAVGTTALSLKDCTTNGQILVWSGAINGWTCGSDANGVIGGQVNYSARWLTSTTLGTGALYDNGTNVGIGSTSPGQKLTVSGGTIQIINGSEGSGKILTSDVSGVASWTSPAASLSGAFWSLSGNTVSAGQFIGSTNNEDLRIRTNNIERMVVGSGGNIGIGTSAPASPLQVVATNASEGIRIQRAAVPLQYLSLSEGDGSAHLIEGFGSKPLRIKNYSTSNSDGLEVYVNGLGTPGLVFTRSGSLAIGLTSPSYGLDLSGSLRVGLGTDFTLSGGYLSYKPGGITCADGEVLGWDNTNSRWVCTARAPGITGSGLTTNYVTKWNGTDLVNSNLFATSTGVGIGTTSPSRKFTVFSDGTIGQAQIRLGYDDSNYWDIGRDNGVDGRLMFKENGTERITFKDGGNLGIGTTSPGQKLTVSGGTIQIIDGNQGAGKVLASDASGVGTWQNASSLFTAPVTSVFGRTGAVIAQSGDYNTSQVTENTNLYFTNARAIAAPLTGFVASAGTVVSTDSILQAFQKLQGTNTLQDTNIATATGQIATLQTNLNTATGNIATITGQLVTINSNIATATGDIATLSGSLSTIRSNIATATGNIATITGQLVTINSNIATATGNISTLSGRVNTLSGVVDLKADINSPLFTGDPRAPTPTTADSDTSLATTAFVKAQNYLTGETDPEVGSNTTNYLSKWNGSALITSQVFDNGTNVGIGTASPSTNLTVSGSTLITGDVTVQGRVITDNIVNRTVTNVTISGSLLPDNAAPLTYRDIGSTTQRWNNLYLSGQITLGGGSPGLNKILTSDANGLASWVTPASTLSGSFWSLSGNTVAAGQFLGSTNNEDLRIYTNNTQRMVVGSGGNVGIGTGNLSTAMLTVAGDISATGRFESPNSTYYFDATNGLANFTSGFFTNLYGSDSVLRLVAATGYTYFPSTAGNIGIGTSAPGYTLDLSGSLRVGTGTNFAYSGGYLSYKPNFAACSNGQILSWDNTNSRWICANDAGSGVTINGTTNYVARFTGASTLGTGSILDTGTGVSIGSSSVLAKFYVNGSTRLDLGSDATGDIYYRQSDGTLARLGLGSSGQILTATTGAPSWQPISATGGAFSGTFWGLDGNNPSSADFFGTLNNEDIRIRTNNTQRMVIGSGGNVGIGTTSPGQKLTVSGGTIQIIDGTQGAGKILTSDASGVATWQTPVASLSGAFWSLSGNVISAGQFIGSTNNADVKIYSNNIERMVIGSGGNVGIGTTAPSEKFEVSGNIKGTRFIGYGAGNISTNSAVGEFSLANNNTGAYNTANGNVSLYSNTVGSYNTANGYAALYANTGGTDNTALGVLALTNNLSNLNTAVGASSLRLNTIGVNNTALGGASLFNNNTGSFNVSLGAYSLYDQTQGSLNTAIGYNTARGITTGSNNTILGSNVTGLAAGLSNNVIIADGSGNRRINVDSSGNVGIGTTTTASGKLNVNADYYDLLAGNYNVDIGLKSTTGGWARAFRVVNTAGSNGLDGGAFGVYGTSATPERVYMAIPTANETGYDSTKIIALNNAGNVGIGTVSPGQKLDVDGNIRVSGASNRGLEFYSGASYGKIGGTSAGPAIWTADSTLGARFYDGALYFNGNAYFKNDVDSAFNMTILDTGNVGIGTTSPGQKLTVSGGTIQIIDGTQGAGKILTSDASGIATWQTPVASLSGAFWSLSGNVISAGQFIGSTNNADVKIYSNNTERMVIGSGGNVGIGIINPSAKLQVGGSTRLDLGSDATGDIFYRSSGGNLARLPAGSSGQILASSAGLPTWQTAATYLSGSFPVISVFGRTGAVLAGTGDYAASQITSVPSGSIASTNVQAALNELDSEKQALITGGATSITSADLTASRALASSSTGKVSVATTTLTELNFLTGATANIQSQLDQKAPLASPLFTGDPRAPTPTTADSDTSLATTAFVKAQNYLTGETDPIWSAASGSYYTKTNVQTSGQAAIHFANLTNVPVASTTASGLVQLVDSYTGTSISQAPTANAVNNLKNYTDALVAGLSWKQAVRVATTANIALSGNQSIDGYTTVTGDRVLVKNQTIATENGIYIAAAGAWSRATDSDSSVEFESMAAYVSTGTTNKTTGWVLANEGAIVLNTTSLAYAQFSGANSYIGSAPIQITGNTISILQSNSGQNGYLSSADFNTFNAKQAFISTGTTLEYYRGDKTFQTLDTSVVPENTNLYFTNARAQSAMTGAISAITNTNLTASRALASDASGKVSVATTTLTELNYLTGATGNIQTQINTLGTNVNTATGNIAIATGVLNMTPVFKVDMIANGTPPARTTSTGFVNVQYVYGPFSPSYSQPTCPAGTTKQYKFYAEFVDNITAPGGQNVAFRIALDGGTNIDISAGYTWGGSTSFRTYLSGFFTTSDTNHGFLQVRVNGSAGPYVEVRNAEIWTYCTQ